MNEWSLYPAVVGTLLSILLWTRFVAREYDEKHPMTLSELGTRRNAQYFRLVLWTCGPLFGLTIIYYLSPKITDAWVIFTLIAVVICEIFTGIFLPRSKRDVILHGIAAYGMAICMLVGAAGLALSVPNSAWIVWILTGAMLACAIMATMKHGKFLLYELMFIFLSHASIVVACLAYALA